MRCQKYLGRFGRLLRQEIRADARFAVYEGSNHSKFEIKSKLGIFQKSDATEIEVSCCK